MRVVTAETVDGDSLDLRSPRDGNLAVALQLGRQNYARASLALVALFAHDEFGHGAPPSVDGRSLLKSQNRRELFVIGVTRSFSLGVFRSEFFARSFSLGVFERLRPNDVQRVEQC